MSSNVPEYIKDYRLDQDKLEEYLRGLFPDAVITVEPNVDDELYVAMIPQSLTDAQKLEVEGLRRIA